MGQGLESETIIEATHEAASEMFQVEFYKRRYIGAFDANVGIHRKGTEPPHEEEMELNEAATPIVGQESRAVTSILADGANVGRVHPFPIRDGSAIYMVSRSVRSLVLVLVLLLYRVFVVLAWLQLLLVGRRSRKRSGIPITSIRNMETGDFLLDGSTVRTKNKLLVHHGVDKVVQWDSDFGGNEGRSRHHDNGGANRDRNRVSHGDTGKSRVRVKVECTDDTTVGGGNSLSMKVRSYFFLWPSLGSIFSPLTAP
jgi:hypothetical protein